MGVGERGTQWVKGVQGGTRGAGWCSDTRGGKGKRMQGCKRSAEDGEGHKGDRGDTIYYTSVGDNSGLNV